MRVLALILFASVIAPVAYAQQGGDLPRDGNALLDYCSVVVDFGDSATSLSSLGEKRLLEQSGKLNWCIGYLQATQDDLSATEIGLAISAMMGVRLSGPDPAKQHTLDSLRFACIPEKATILQLARVLVKWLREHPERLHEPRAILLRDALKGAFPCTAPAPTKEVPGPTTVKP